MAKKQRPKQKPKNKRMQLNKAAVRDMQEQIYWQILSMFLAAAVDLYQWTDDTVAEYAARVNWYFNATFKEKLITLDHVHEIIQERSGLIMQKTRDYQYKIDIDLLGPEPEKEPEMPKRKQKAYFTTDGTNDWCEIVFAANVKEARIKAFNLVFREWEGTRYIDVLARRIPELDHCYKGMPLLDWNDEANWPALRAAGLWTPEEAQ